MLNLRKVTNNETVIEISKICRKIKKKQTNKQINKTTTTGIEPKPNEEHFQRHYSAQQTYKK